MPETTHELRVRAVATGTGGFEGRYITPSPIGHASETDEAYLPLSSSHIPDRIRQLAAGIAHDYNNLFTSMLCGAGMALENLAPDHPARPALEIASGAVQRAAELTRQLMAYAGISSFVVSHVDLSALVRNVVGSCHPSIPRSVRLRLDLAANLPLLQADTGQVELLVNALLQNAVEAISDAAGVVSVRTYAGRAGNITPPRAGTYIHMEVSDTGCGMDETTKSRIFEPFFSTKFLGRGLGLAAVAGIVRTHRGTIEVLGAPGSGTTFHVCLPVGAPGSKACD